MTGGTVSHSHLVGDTMSHMTGDIVGCKTDGPVSHLTGDIGYQVAALHRVGKIREFFEKFE